MAPQQAAGGNAASATAGSSSASTQPERPLSPWRNSTAKQQLVDDIVSGRTRNAKNSTEVYYSRSLYQRYDLKNFQTNYRNLKKKISERRNMASAGREAYAHDLPIIHDYRSKTGQFYYSGSTVQQLLQHDVQKGNTDGLTASEVMDLRPIYKTTQGLGLRKFADHLSYKRRLHQRRLQNEEYGRRMRFVNARIEIDNH